VVPPGKAIDDPGVLAAELDRVRHEYNTVRLHVGIGYVTPDDEHEGRGARTRKARLEGMRQSRADRIAYRRRHPINRAPKPAGRSSGPASRRPRRTLTSGRGWGTSQDRLVDGLEPSDGDTVCESFLEAVSVPLAVVVNKLGVV
jgi:hypothetical protein